MNTIQNAWSVRQESKQGVIVYTGLIRVLGNGLIDLVHNSGMEELFFEFLRYEDNLPRLRTEWVPKDGDDNEQQYLEKWVRKAQYGLLADVRYLGRRICDGSKVRKKWEVEDNACTDEMILQALGSCAEIENPMVEGRTTRGRTTTWTVTLAAPPDKDAFPLRYERDGEEAAIWVRRAAPRQAVILHKPARGDGGSYNFSEAQIPVVKEMVTEKGAQLRSRRRPTSAWATARPTPNKKTLDTQPHLQKRVKSRSGSCPRASR